MNADLTIPATLPRWVKRLYYTALVILSLVGITSLAVRLIYGLKVTALTIPIPWGMWVAIYICFRFISRFVPSVNARVCFRDAPV